jgi:DNA-binding transcriptional LysR family regulator
MSEGIAALERAIGTRIALRKRGERGIRLTAAGEALLPFARGVLSSLENARIAVAAVDRQIRTHVEVIANESVSTYVLPPALGEVRKQWPKLRFAVSVGMCPSITEGLSAARYDVGLLMQSGACPPVDPAPHGSSEGLYSVFLAEVPLVMVAAAGHPLLSATDPPLSRDRLATYPVFISDAYGRFFDIVRDFFTIEGAPHSGLEATGSVEAVKRSVFSENGGLGVLPIYAVADELRTRRVSLVKIRPELPRFRLEAMCYRAKPAVHPAIADLLDAVRRSVSQLSELHLAVASRRSETTSRS